MSDKIDLDNPSTRDPRLASRATRFNIPPPIKKPSLERQNSISLGSPSTPKPAVFPPPNEPPKPVEKQDNPRDGSFIQSISELVQAAVATAVSRSEKERLQQKKEITEGLLKKAKDHTNFPSTAAFFQQASNDEKVDMTRMDDTIKEHLSNCSQIERDLVTKWGLLSPSGPGSSASEETIKNLQRELQTFKEEAASTKAELARLVDSSPTRTGPIKILQDRVILLEKTMGNQTSLLSEQANTAKANDERLTSLSSEMKKGAVSSPIREALPTQFENDIGELKQKHTEAEGTMKALVECQEALSKTIHQINGDIEEHRRELNDINVGSISAMKARMDSFSNHLSSLAGKVVTESPTAQSVNGNTAPQINKDQVNQSMQALNGRMDELSHLQSMKDDFQFSEMEEIKKILAQQSEEFKGLRDGYGQVSTEIKAIAQSKPAAALRQIQDLSGSLSVTQRVLESVKVGLHSLETRYNNISTEPIVKNMVAAMQEMYPSASQLTEQVTALRNSLDKDILPLKSTVEQLFKSHSSQVTQLQKDTAVQLEEKNRFKTEHVRMEQSVAGLLERIKAQTSMPTQQQFNQLQSKVDSLSKKINEQTFNISEQLKSKQWSDESLVQSLNHEREHFNKEFQRLSSELKDMLSKLSQLQSTNTTNMEATKSHADDIGSLLDRMRHLEESASNNHEQLLKQFDYIKKAVENQEGMLMDGQAAEEPQSPPQKVEGDEEPEPEVPEGPTESPANGDSTTISQIAETNPALALREKKRKKKRPRTSMNASDDERPEPHSGSNSPRMLIPGRDGTPSTDAKKKTKKKKRRNLIQDTEPITLD
ncbi:uncharacterized protein ASPGLDRAFT_121097 [Aspergillus glaucus CBS 516.65]|uniref:Paramyosin n=1 Tax=Aspergillus glaucus CBS 516.65 TaxID=1160497 RepID=A0A1L9VS70_ASPGL|nr:hypothetical protein ASPGLDRAFT_121097 [Aspergillus glaucus CBS 516.65]OJJ86759.1 hypothetical protein ASPGLDRAFT_121097 [Aspergillus glaucus CBS 516.65]